MRMRARQRREAEHACSFAGGGTLGPPRGGRWDVSVAAVCAA